MMVWERNQIILTPTNILTHMEKKYLFQKIWFLSVLSPYLWFGSNSNQKRDKVHDSSWVLPTPLCTLLSHTQKSHTKHIFALRNGVDLGHAQGRECQLVGTLHFLFDSKSNQIWFEPNKRKEPNLIRNTIFSINF